MQTPTDSHPDALAHQANQALLQQFRRLNPGQHLVGDQTCVLHASLGIDTQAPPGAPGGEMVRVYVYTDNPQTFSLLDLATYLCIPQPLIKSAMQFVTVLKHGEQPAEVLALEPGHADGLNLLSHEVPPCVESCIVRGKMQTPKDNCLNIGRDDITNPGLFVYAPRAPAHGYDDCGWQCLFGGNHHVVQQYIAGGWIEAGVWRDSEKPIAELRICIYMTDGGRQETQLKLGADDMQTLACALIDAAHHLRTVPAAPYVAPVAVAVKAEAVPA